MYYPSGSDTPIWNLAYIQIIDNWERCLLRAWFYILSLDVHYIAIHIAAILQNVILSSQCHLWCKCANVFLSRKREERAKRVAENQAMKQREEEERKRRAQGQWVHEEQMKKIAQKKAKEMEERNRKHKEVRQEGHGFIRDFYWGGGGSIIGTCNTACEGGITLTICTRNLCHPYVYLLLLLSNILWKFLGGGGGGEETRGGGNVLYNVGHHPHFSNVCPQTFLSSTLLIAYLTFELTCSKEKIFFA